MLNDDHGKFKKSLLIRYINSFVSIDTNASYAGTWFFNFYQTTLTSNPELLQGTLIFDHV